MVSDWRRPLYLVELASHAEALVGDVGDKSNVIVLVDKSVNFVSGKGGHGGSNLSY